MRILFSADWHIKLGQKNVPREWQRNRYRLLFEKIHELSKDVDMVINGGDIFDKIPSLEELELYFEYISGITTKTIIYDGNHEATRKGKTFLDNLKDVTSNINPRVSIWTGCHMLTESIDLVSYCELKNITKCKQRGNILVTHVRGEIPPHVQPEIDLSLLDKWDVVLAGDLHAYENSQRNILYPGSPLSTSFHRNPVKNGVIIFDTETLEHEWIELGLPQLIRKTVDKTEDMVKTDYDHTIYEITGNMSDIANIDLSDELIDKKIIKKDSDKKLDLTNMTFSDELKLYLEEILKLDKGQVLDIMGTYNDYIREDDME